MLKLTQEIPKAHKEYIWCIKFHPLENIFASCGNDKIVSIFEYSSLEKKHQFFLKHIKKQFVL